MEAIVFCVVTMANGVNRSQFESIVENLLKQQPATRKDERTGKKKSGELIIPKTASEQDQASRHQPRSGKSTEKPEPSC